MRNGAQTTGLKLERGIYETVVDRSSEHRCLDNDYRLHMLDNIGIRTGQ